MPKLLTKHEFSTLKNINKASYIEMFFDLVFIFCLHQTMPVVTGIEADTVDWYTFYTFTFTTVLLLQVWFDTTIFMNRFGSGGPLDVAFFVVITFLLIIMTQCVSTDWDNYVIYNACWILILVNVVAHWIVRYKMISNPDRRFTHHAKRTITILLIEALVVFIATLCDSFSGQILALVALIIGFSSWFGRDANLMNNSHYNHLAERCSLLIVMSFGETVAAACLFTDLQDETLNGLLYLLIILTMFFIYLIELERALDFTKMRNGLGYMAITAWQTFNIANITVSFQLMVKEINLWFMDSSLYFSVSVAVFLLSFFLYQPYNRSGNHSRKRWFCIRFIACLGTLLLSAALMQSISSLVMPNSISRVTPPEEDTVLLTITTVIGLIAVVLVFLLDWKRYGAESNNLYQDEEEEKSESPQEEADSLDISKDE